MRYRSGVFTIKRRGDLTWDGLQLGSGFDVELKYAKDVVLNNDGVGVDDDFGLTPLLARFLTKNRDLISIRLPAIEKIIQEYRDFYWQEARRKAAGLSYRFLNSIYDKPQDSKALVARLSEEEIDLRVLQLFASNELACDSAHERVLAVTSSEAKAWWYLFWDDLWRRNYDTITAMQTYASDFNPHYPTSIAYRPLSRPALEAFLVQRGLYSMTSNTTNFFHSGFLNKLYFRLNGIVFHDPRHAIVFHLGEGESEFDLEDIDTTTHARTSSLGTGGGTDHDDSSIRARPNYRWEGILEDPLSKTKQSKKEGWAAKFGVWFGLTPLWRTGVVSQGLALDVTLENGKYVMLGSDSSAAARTSTVRK